MPVRPWVALPAAVAPLGLGALQLARMRLRGVGAPPANLIGSTLGRLHAYWAEPSSSCLCHSSWAQLQGRQLSRDHHGW